MIVGHREFGVAKPRQSKLQVLLRVQAKHHDYSLRLVRSSFERSIGPHEDLAGSQASTWIGQVAISLAAIAGVARVDQVIVVAGTLRRFHLWFKVVNVEVPAEAAPLFSRETVNATERELVAQPGTVGRVVGISSWPMPTQECCGWIIESSHKKKRPTLLFVAASQEASGGVSGRPRWVAEQPDRSGLAPVSVTQQVRVIRQG